MWEAESVRNTVVRVIRVIISLSHQTPPIYEECVRREGFPIQICGFVGIMFFGFVVGVI